MANDKMTRKSEVRGMFAIVFFALILALVILSGATGCAVQKPVTPTVIVRDSIIYRDRVVHDTAKFEIPVIVEKNVTRDTVSHLENAYAKSDAVVSEGFLTHSLETRPQTIYVPVETHITDTLVIHDETQIIPQTVEVPAELTWWQKFRIGAFWWLVALCVVGWRRELLALGKKLIKLLGL